MTVRILVGDVREQLRKLPDASFDCVVTSPPYWGLRDYGVAGQIGLERTLGEHLDVLVNVFREVRRVLKAHGTVWLNYGDCYAAQPNGKSAAEYKADGSDDRTFRDKPFSTVGPIYDPNYETPGKRPGASQNMGQMAAAHGGRIIPGGYVKPKDLCMIPNRLAIALQDDGWWVRSEIIWHKPNPMPESIYDRPTSAHEKIWLLAKSEDYFYNHAAIREPVTGSSHPRTPAEDGNNKGVGRRIDRIKVPGGWDVEAGAHGTINRSGRTAATYVSKSGNKSRKLREDHGGFSGRNSHQGYGIPWEGDTRNARNVWTIAPKPFKEAHFATFPPELAERCIRAGVPLRTCSFCGEARTDCGGMCTTAEHSPGRVLDPFGGAGTVGLVAQQLGLDATLIELNPEYAAIARRRLGMEIAEAAE